MNNKTNGSATEINLSLSYVLVCGTIRECAVQCFERINVAQ